MRRPFETKYGEMTLAKPNASKAGKLIVMRERPRAEVWTLDKEIEEYSKLYIELLSCLMGVGGELFGCYREALRRAQPDFPPAS